RLQGMPLDKDQLKTYTRQMLLRGILPADIKLGVDSALTFMNQVYEMTGKPLSERAGEAFDYGWWNNFVRQNWRWETVLTDFKIENDMPFAYAFLNSLYEITTEASVRRKGTGYVAAFQFMHAGKPVGTQEIAVPTANDALARTYLERGEKNP